LSDCNTVSSKFASVISSAILILLLGYNAKLVNYFSKAYNQRIRFDYVLIS